MIEVAKAYWHRGQEPRLWFWRTATGEEVDLFVETAGGIVAVEAKATATPTPSTPSRPTGTGWLRSVPPGYRLLGINRNALKGEASRQGVTARRPLAPVREKQLASDRAAYWSTKPH